MQRYYDFSTKGFLFEGHHTIPTTAIPISEGDFETLSNAGREGKVIARNESGYPVAVTLAPPTPAKTELAAQRKDDLCQKIAANDLASVGLLRAKVAGTATKEEEEELIALDQRAKELKAELAALTD